MIAEPMSGENLTAKTHEGIGEFFCAWSGVEQQINEAVKVVLGLRNNDASDAIVTLIGDFSKKATLVLAAIKDAKKGDGSPTTEEWKQKAKATISDAFASNDDRVLLAHRIKSVNADGSVEFLPRLLLDKGKIKAQDSDPWSYTDLTDKVSHVKAVAKKLEALGMDLRNITITIPAPDLDWLANFSRPIPPVLKWFGGGAVDPVDPSS
jgi:hypothetical protein